jgi:single-strand DNA-binding protein
MPLPRGAVECRLAAEPELRFSQAGKAIARLRVVASDRRRNEQTGEWEDSDSLWLDVTCFDKLAENVCESLVKGDLLLVVGRWRTDEWTDRESGQKRSKITLIADAAGPSLQFRVTPHGVKAQQQREFTHPVQQAYGDAEPPF